MQQSLAACILGVACLGLFNWGTEPTDEAQKIILGISAAMFFATALICEAISQTRAPSGP